jgi:hypothetical protein
VLFAALQERVLLLLGVMLEDERAIELELLLCVALLLDDGNVSSLLLLCSLLDSGIAISVQSTLTALQSKGLSRSNDEHEISSANITAKINITPPQKTK